MLLRSYHFQSDCHFNYTILSKPSALVCGNNDIDTQFRHLIKDSKYENNKINKQH